jgi:hypothetical protein
MNTERSGGERGSIYVGGEDERRDASGRRESKRERSRMRTDSRERRSRAADQARESTMAAATTSTLLTASSQRLKSAVDGVLSKRSFVVVVS